MMADAPSTAAPDSGFLTKWAMRLSIGLLVLLLLVFGIGSLLPATFQSHAMIATTKITPERFWAVVTDPTRCSLSTDPTCVVTLKADVDGLPAWEEQIRGALIDVQVIEHDRLKRIVWDLQDRGGALSTRWVLTMQVNASGSTMVAIDETGQVGGGLNAPIFKWAMFASGGWGPQEYLKRLEKAASGP